MIQYIKNLFGDKHFYRHVFLIATPIIIQQLMFALGGYVDSLMINAYGTGSQAYSGVSAANRLMTIFSFLFMALASATSIFISQFYGAKNKDKIKTVFTLSCATSIAIGAVSFLFIHFFGNSIVDIFIQDSASRAYGHRYLSVMKWGMIIWAFNMSISASFRTVKQIMLPMVVGILGIITNTSLNYLLIFGNFGFPELDSVGAAIATVSSRSLEVLILLIVALWGRKSYFKKFWKHRHISKDLLSSFAKRGLPLVANELLWATMVAVLIMYTTYKNDLWYTSYAYALQITDLFFVFFAGLANATAIIIGPKLGADEFEEARKDSIYMNSLGVILGTVMATLMVVFAPSIVSVFGASQEVSSLTIKLIATVAIFVPAYAYNATCFFALRAGGDSLRAFILDQGATILIAFPISVVMGINSVAWGVTVVEIYFVSHLADIFKVFISHIFVKKGAWLVNLTNVE